MSREVLGERGRGIYDAYGASSLPLGTQAVVVELARLADSLDKLDGLLAGKRDEWAVIITDEMSGEVHLEVDKLLAERRQYALALKVLYNELRSAGVKEDGGKQEEKGGGRENLILSLVRDVG